MRDEFAIYDERRKINWPDPVDFLTDQDAGLPELKPEHCPEALWPYVEDTAQRMGCDPSSVMLSCIVTCASVTTDDWRIQPRVNDYTWTENARLWGLLLGPPGAMKTPIIKACTIPIERLDAAARECYKDEKRKHKKALNVWKEAPGDTPEPAPPRLARYLVESTSVEAFSEVLRDDDGGWQVAPAKKVLCRQDEMSEFFANMDKYNPSGKSGGDQGTYLRLYNGGRYNLDRVIRGCFAVPNWSACFIGGIQPGPIQRIAQAATEDGMLQRFMYSVASERLQGVDRAPNGAAIQRYHALIPALAAMHPTSINADDDISDVVTLHTDAHQHRHHINAVASAMASMPDTSGRLKSAFDKWAGLFARLCLTFHLIDVAQAKLAGTERPYLQVVPEKTARMVAAYMQDILLPHLLRAEAMMFATAQTSYARWIAGHILARDLEVITARDVVRAYRELRAPEHRNELNAVMSSLVTVGWLEPVWSDNPGKPVSTWMVNPSVHTAFPAKKARERARWENNRDMAHERFAAIRRERNTAAG